MVGMAKQFSAVTVRDLVALIADLEVNPDLSPESFYQHMYFTKSQARADALAKLIGKLSKSYSKKA